MKFNCGRVVLASALGSVSGVLASKTPKEIIKSVKVESREGGVYLVATDLETSVRRKVADCEADAAGDLLVNPSRLQSILKEVPDERVSLNIEGDVLTVKGGNSRFKLAMQDAAEFPQIGEFDAKDYLSILASVFRKQITRTVFAVDTDSKRYSMGGVLCEFGGNNLKMIATDSRRMAIASGDVGQMFGSIDDGVNIIVPPKALNLIDRIVADESEGVSIKFAIRERDLVVQTETSTIFSRGVDGRFPNYRQAIPGSSKVEVPLVVGPLLSVVRQSQIVTDVESRGVAFSFDKGNLTLKSTAASVGEATIELPIDYSADAINVSFDPKFIADFLRVLQPEQQVTLGLSDGRSMAVFMVDDYMYVLAPLEDR